MAIRQATPDDFAIIQALNDEIFQYEYEHGDLYINRDYATSPVGIEFYKDIVNCTNGHSGWLYEEDGVAKGYVSLRIHRESEVKHRNNIKPIQLQTLCVGEAYRGQGIGRKLVEHVKQIAKDQGYSHLRVCALAQNARARSLYTSSGFHEQEIMHEMVL